MSPFEAYKLYLAIKQHFYSKTYDFEKYQGKVRANPHSFEKRPDKWFFSKLAKHRDVKGFLVANLVSSDAWIGDLLSEKGEEIYLEWKRNQESLTYLYKLDLYKLLPDFNENFTINNDHPYIIRLYLSKEISLETLVILIDLARCTSHWDKKMKDDIVWNDLTRKIKKYRVFFKYDRASMKGLTLEKFSKARA